MNLNFIRLTFDPDQKPTHQLLSDPYKLHQFIYQTMSSNSDPGRILYRLEVGNGACNQLPTVLIQTKHPVVCNFKTRRWGFPTFINVEDKSSALALQKQNIYQFRTRVNPVRSGPPINGKQPGKRGRGKKIAITSTNDQLEWGVKLLLKNGMGVECVKNKNGKRGWRQTMRVLRRN